MRHHSTATLVALSLLLGHLIAPVGAEAQVWTHSTTSTPSSARSTLSTIKTRGQQIQTMAFTPSNQWVIVAANQMYVSSGFPSSVRNDITRYIDAGKQIDAVAFAPSGAWLIIAQDWLRRSNIPESAYTNIRAVQSAGRRVVSFAFHPTSTSSWILVDNFGDVRNSSGMPSSLTQAIADAGRGQRQIHEISFTPSGGWILVAGDWFVSSGAPSNLLPHLERFRTVDNRRIDHVVFGGSSSSTHWTLISNTRESTSTARTYRFEHGLNGTSSIYSRMKAHQITGLAIAYIDNNTVAWARGYGLREADRLESYVTPNTIFDAASLSKPMSAAAALRLVDAGELSLTRSNSAAIVSNSFRDPANGQNYLNVVKPSDFNLNQLLSHCAGLALATGASGVQSFSDGASLPRVAQIILGHSPASSTYRVVRDTAAGAAALYSGANYTILTALIDEETGGYTSYMSSLLSDLGMSSSTFTTPIPSSQRSRYAHGHDKGAKQSIKAYPAKAAASLTSTVEDLAKFVRMLNDQGVYGGQRILQSSTVDQFLRRTSTENGRCSNRGSMGLGMRVDNPGTTNEVFRHRGSHNGYRAYIFGIPQRNLLGRSGRERRGIAILMTGDIKSNNPDADNFAAELLNSLESVYGLPNLSP